MEMSHSKWQKHFYCSHNTRLVQKPCLRVFTGQQVPSCKPVILYKFLCLKRHSWQFWQCYTWSITKKKFQVVSQAMTLCTGWLKSHATHIEIFIDGCNSVHFDWINKHTILLWPYKSPHRSHITCSCQSISCLSTVKVQGCLFHKCSEFSLSNATTKVTEKSFFSEWIILWKCV
jgi:hypothetical protein